MAFGKKKDEAGEAGVVAATDADDDAPLFPDSGDDPVADDAAPVEAPAPAVAPSPEPVAEVAPTPAPEAAADAAPSTDALLSAFRTDDGANDDRSVLVELAGDVGLADLLEELNTLAAAMNVVQR